MAAFEVLFQDHTEIVDDADGYELEGPLTTFFRSDRGRVALDAWAIRIASFRSADVRAVRRVERCPTAGDAPRLVVGAGAAG